MLSKKSAYEKDIHLRYLHKLGIHVMMLADCYNYEDGKMAVDAQTPRAHTSSLSHLYI
jgi:hypothetical protein